MSTTGETAADKSGTRGGAALGPAPIDDDQTRRHLAATRDALLVHCAGLTPEAWQAGAGSGRWTPAQILEHLVLVENRIQKLLHRMLEAPPEPDWRERTEAKEMALVASASPAKKIEAPPAIQPQGQQPVAELLAEFAAARERTLALVSRHAELEPHVRPHIALGDLNGWQWLRMLGYHTERHLSQMRRI